ncbi:hypothetical protein Tco_0131224, partial [Tanacetum coccineum]
MRRREYHLDRSKEVKVAGRGIWGDNGWTWVWDWARELQGRVVEELIGLEDLVYHVNLTGRLPVRVELDRKGIDLHSLLCPWCDDACGSFDHAIVLCNEVMKVWSVVFGWWKLGNVNAFTAY